MFIRLIFCYLLIVFSVSSHAQERGKNARRVNEARQAWQMRDYSKAESAAQKVLEADAENLEMLLLLADIYHETNQLEKEINYLETALRLKAPMLVHFRLGESYFKTTNYEKALQSINSFLANNPTPSLVKRATKIRNDAEFAVEAMKNPVDFSPENMGENINSELDEYWPSLTVDGATIIFTRLVPEKENGKMLQEDFFLSTSDSSGWQPAQAVEGVNTHLNEGAQTISADGKLLFYTLCNHPQGFGSCDIWFSRFVDGNWTPPRNAGRQLNSEAWEGQPSFSDIGRRLFFTSNRTGGKGGNDIWSIELKGWSVDGSPVWGQPVNLGDSINTPGDEISPFIHFNGRDLFFSSDEWPGMGGLDLFRSQQKPDGSWTKAQNLGYPVNTAGNEQGLVIERTGNVAYLASNREEGRGMDIYTFQLPEEIQPEPVTYIKGKVSDLKTGNPVAANVQLKGLDSAGSLEITAKADKDGLFTMMLPIAQQFAFHIEEPGYLFYSENFRIEHSRSYAEPVYREIFLTPVEVGTITHLYNIFFETGSHEILPQSEPELNTLIIFLHQNSTLNVEIQGHTDNVGTEKYNLDLSERRASAVVDYLIKSGIDQKRLASKGYGYSEPVDTNDTDEGRAKNRRTTIKVTAVSEPLR